VEAARYGADLLGPHTVRATSGNPEAFGSSFHGVLIRDVTLGYLDYTTAVEVETKRLPDHHLVLVPAPGASTITSGGIEVAASPVMAAIPRPGQPMTLACEADVAHLVVRIGRAALESHLSRLLGRTLDRPIEFAPAFDLSAGASSRWNFGVQLLHAELYENDSLLHQFAGVGPLEEFLMSALLFCQESNYRSLLHPSARQTSRIVTEAVDYIDQHLAEAITVDDIAAHVDVSVRTLQSQFARDLDQTPTNVLRDRRLERARSDLADASPGSGVSVTAVATRWGFTHLGRFAVNYKNRYGESPSQTLKS
jgi:AraC-like DNA-binding protein